MRWWAAWGLVTWTGLSSEQRVAGVVVSHAQNQSCLVPVSQRRGLVRSMSTRLPRHPSETPL